jgi:hypothetical protein
LISNLIFVTEHELQLIYELDKVKTYVSAGLNVFGNIESVNVDTPILNWLGYGALNRLVKVVFVKLLEDQITFAGSNLELMTQLTTILSNELYKLFTPLTYTTGIGSAIIVS